MRYFYWLAQTLMWPAVWILIRLFYRVEIRGRENLEKISPPLVIASNHKTLFDGFLILIALPWFSRFLPGRYMTEELHFRGPVLEFLRKLRVLQFIYRLTGGFPSYRGEGIERAIGHPLKFLQSKGTVLMFPEGRLAPGDGLGVFYNGTAALVAKSGAPILPFFIKIERRKIIITIGESFKLNTDSIETGTRILRDKIASLPH